MVKNYYPFITGLFVFVVYLFTLAPTVLQIDSGELAAVQSLLGIAHPTGYPLFTLLGYLFLLLPLPFTSIFMSNLLAAIWCAAGAIVFIKSAGLIFTNIYSKNSDRGHRLNTSKKDKREISSDIEINDITKIVILISAGLITAFSKTIWLQSASVEVYSLHILLMNLIIYFLLRAYFNDNINLIKWLLLAFILALGFSNHMTTILIIPGVAILFFSKEKISLNVIKTLSLMLLLFFVTLIVLYAYLPIRASQNPPLNWGNPIDLERFVRHFTGQQYQVWIFSSFASAKKQLAYFANNLMLEFTIPTLIVIIIGALSVFKRNKILFFFIAVSFIVTVLYSVNYDINDIDSYFILAYISLGFFSLFGIAALYTFFSKRKVKGYYTFGLLLLLLAYQVYSNFQNVDQSDIYVYEDYTKAVLSSTETNSIVFSYQWDYFISQSHYIQKVENFRNDVVVIDKELLRRSWYYKQLAGNHPEVLQYIRNDIDIFLGALLPFERGENFNANLLETYYRKIMAGLITSNIEKRDYYIGLELVENEMRRGEFSLPTGYNLAPHLLMFKVTKENEYVPAPDPDFIIRFPVKSDVYIDSIKRMVATMLINRAIYEIQFNKPERAKVYANRIITEFPGYKLPQQIKHLMTR